MNEIQIELTRLIGKKERMLRDDFYDNTWCPSSLIAEESDYELKEIPATLSDFHRWMNEKWIEWEQRIDWFEISESNWVHFQKYDSNKKLLEQSEECLKQIVALVKSS